MKRGMKGPSILRELARQRLLAIGAGLGLAPDLRKLDEGWVVIGGARGVVLLPAERD